MACVSASVSIYKSREKKGDLPKEKLFRVDEVGRDMENLGIEKTIKEETTD